MRWFSSKWRSTTLTSAHREYLAQFLTAHTGHEITVAELNHTLSTFKSAREAFS